MAAKGQGKRPSNSGKIKGSFTTGKNYVIKGGAKQAKMTQDKTKGATRTPIGKRR